MGILLKIRDLLKGRKTYGVGIIAILLGLYVGGSEGKEMIITGLGFMTLKAGQTSSNQEQTAEIETPPEGTGQDPVEETGGNTQ